MGKKVLITGVTGQDGSYLAEYLLGLEYQVFGLVRTISTEPPPRLRANHLSGQIKLVSGDLTDPSSLIRILQELRPDEVYNLAAQSFVPDSWHQPILTGEVNALGVTRLLEAIRIVDPNIRFYQASTSEMFGNSPPPQNEEALFHPRSPYAVAKLYSHWITVNYRESFNLFACSGILFNHESPRRGSDFVTQKIAHKVANLHLGTAQNPLELGNLDAQRDWGYAPDYVRAMHLMLQQEKADDFVVGTGQAHTVREFVEAAFAVLDTPIVWEGEELTEVGRNAETGTVLVRVNKAFYRPVDINLLLADARKARRVLGWKPTVTFEQLVEMMVKAALERYM